MLTLRGRARVDASALRATLRHLVPLVRQEKKLVALGLLAVFVEVLATLAEPWPLKLVIDEVLPAALTGAPPAGGEVVGLPVLALLAAAGLLAATALRAGASYASTVCFAMVGSRVTIRLRAAAYQRVLSQSVHYHQARSGGDLLARLTADITRLQEVAVTAGLPLLANVITFVGMAIVMLVLDPLLACVVLLAVPLFVIGAGRTGGKVTSAAREQRMAEGTVAGLVGESLGSVRVVQAYRLEEPLAVRFGASNTASLRSGVRTQRLAAGLERRTDLLIGSATAVVLLIGTMRVVDGALTLGELVVFISYLKSVFKPMRNLAKYTGRIGKAAASGERVAELLDAEPELRDEPWARPLRRAHGDIRLVDVTVAHGPDRPVLRGACLHVRPGERVGVVGPSGSGKSTLVALLLRLLDPQSGRVLLDGHDLRDLTLASVRSTCAVVLQESVLFADTVRENIRLARPEAADDEVCAAAVAADADAFIRELPDGYDTVLAERGDSLSGGQRQRLAIARAVLRDAPVVLLDEPTTGLDAQSRRSVLAALDRLTAGRTVLVVAHHEELLASCDRLVRIDDGRIEELPRPARPATDAVSTGGA
ncbi:ABC transporter ATP-binding protein [Pseudonocardia nigra]|uniref:ABC transporter ATP-binding protein n=1 Tax=Pseudonocardia nigra TaxID=1921578 RepID=UPI001C5E857F|nr:ABC transporter ATP-binding protein [Pseudonocardia nigra]